MWLSFGDYFGFAVVLWCDCVVIALYCDCVAIALCSVSVSCSEFLELGLSFLVAALCYDGLFFWLPCVFGCVVLWLLRLVMTVCDGSVFLIFSLCVVLCVLCVSLVQFKNVHVWFPTVAITPLDPQPPPFLFLSRLHSPGYYWWSNRVMGTSLSCVVSFLETLESGKRPYSCATPTIGSRRITWAPLVLTLWATNYPILFELVDRVRVKVRVRVRVGLKVRFRVRVRVRVGQR